MRHVNDQRMVGWPALCRKNAGHGCGVFRIGPEAVDRLSGEGDEATTVQDSRSFLHCGAKFLTRSHGLVAPRRGWQRRTLVMRGPLPPLPVESQPDSVPANKGQIWVVGERVYLFVFSQSPVHIAQNGPLVHSCAAQFAVGIAFGVAWAAASRLAKP